MANDKISKEITDILKKRTKSAILKGVIDSDYIEELKSRIVKRTKLGTGVDPDTGASQRLKKLSEGYKKTRKRRRGSLDGTTTPAKSNLTATGQLLNSLEVIKKVIQDGISLTITVKDPRGTNLDGKQSKIGNKKLVEYLKAGGRQFLGLTKSQQNEILKDIRQILKKFL